MYDRDRHLINVEAPSSKIQPRQDCILVRRILDSEMHESGLEMPQIALNPAEGTIRLGRVIRVGLGDRKPDSSRHVMYNKEGDIVAYKRVPDNDFRIDGVEMTFLREEQHVLAIL
jgi:co-chaperonin GroES (HSP10)